MACERLEDQPALVDLRRAAWSSRRELREVAEDRAPQLDMATLDAQVVASWSRSRTPIAGSGAG